MLAVVGGAEEIDRRIPFGSISGSTTTLLATLLLAGIATSCGWFLGGALFIANNRSRNLKSYRRTALVRSNSPTRRAIAGRWGIASR
jgi:hypothetical protein